MTHKTAKRPKKYTSIGKIQQITWLDHSSHKGWTSDSDPMVTASTTGTVIKETEKYVQLAATICHEDDQIGMVMNIIKSCILKRRTLK